MKDGDRMELTFHVGEPQEIFPECADNPEPRLACVLLLDVSASMTRKLPGGRPIDMLNEGLKLYEQEIKKDLRTSATVEVAIVTFDSQVHVVQDFVGAYDFAAPALTAGNSTAMGAGLSRALELVRERKQVYKDHHINYYRPMVFLITDGEPTDYESVWRAAAQDAHAEEARNGVSLFVIGVDGANFPVLQEISPPTRSPVALDGVKFREFFQWLRNSQEQISRSVAGAQVEMEPITGWARLPA